MERMESECHYSDGPDGTRGEPVIVQVCPRGTYRVLYKHVDQSLTQFLGGRLGPFPTLLMEKLSVSERAHGLSTIPQQVQGKCRIRASEAKDKLPDPITLFIQGLRTEQK